MVNTLEKASGKFSGQILLDTSIKAPTVIYAMQKGKGEPWYPNGYEVKLSDAWGRYLKPYQFYGLDSPIDPNHIHFQIHDESLN